MYGSFNDTRTKNAVAALQKALTSGEEDAVNQAWMEFHGSIVQTVMDDYQEAQSDARILAQRGYRQLTKQEETFYQKFIEANKKSNIKQAITDLVTLDGGMPETIIEDVYKELVAEHPLLAKIDFRNVKYMTKWLLSDRTKQTAAWGEINSEITKEITSGFKVVPMTLNKLTAFMFIPKDMLLLGPTFLDNYVRTVLKEALYLALEQGIISGSGLNCIIGLDRDIHKGVLVSEEDGYPQKTPVPLTSFMPEVYGPVLARLAVTEKGNMRKFDEVTLVVNQVDYLNKVMPATTVLNNAGSFARNVFPFPTEVIRTTELTTGSAILFLPEEFFVGVGMSKEGSIEYDDSYKFLEDLRTYTIRLYANGRAYDNTVALLLDISNLEPGYIMVKNVTTE